MKKIKFSSHYQRMFKKYVAKDSVAFESYHDAVSVFLLDRTNPTLNDHPLRSTLRNYRAFSVTEDIRVLYKETEDGYIFLRVGPHRIVYKP